MVHLFAMIAVRGVEAQSLIATCINTRPQFKTDQFKLIERDEDRVDACYGVETHETTVSRRRTEDDRDDDPIPVGSVLFRSDSVEQEAANHMRILAAAALLFLCVSASAQNESLPPLPPLTDPPSNEHLPGKFVWADLFTSDVDRARRFYEQVFDWDWRIVTLEPRHYGLLYNDGKSIAGIVHRDPPEGHRDYGRWVHFISADDVRKTGSAIVAKGGEELLAYGNHAERGEFAIYAGPHQEVVGIIRSSSGDPPDYQGRVGDWIWWELFTRAVKGAVAHYQSFFGYDAYERQDTSEFLAVHLAAHGHTRAAVGPLPDDPQASPNWIGFIRVGDMTRTLEKVVAGGGEVLLESDPEGLDSDLAVIADPLGTLVGLLRWEYPQDGEETQP